MSEKVANSMQETIRSFFAWLGREGENYKDDLEKAVDLFWGRRPDLSSIDENPNSKAFFNEWLMLDFSTNGYDNTPPAKRKNFMDTFLHYEKNQLSEAGQVFSGNISKSFPSFFRIRKIKKGEYADMADLFSEKEIRVWDVNLSRSAKKGIIIHGRHCKNEEGRYIGAGARVTFVPEPVFEVLHNLILETLKMVRDEGVKITLPEFLKWNSYLYYREMMALMNGNFGDDVV